MKVLVVDDHPLIQAALAQLLPRGERPITVLGAADREEAYAPRLCCGRCREVLFQQ